MFVVYAGHQAGFYLAMVPAALSPEQIESGEVKTFRAFDAALVRVPGAVMPCIPSDLQ
jgi:hypothetical protein